jgi:excisionase family DNA binding protein
MYLSPGDAPVDRPRLVTVKQAAALLNLSRSTLYMLIAAGELEIVHVGRAMRVPVAGIDDFVCRLRAGSH